MTQKERKARWFRATELYLNGCIEVLTYSDLLDQASYDPTNGAIDPAEIEELKQAHRDEYKETFSHLLEFDGDFNPLAPNHAKPYFMDFYEYWENTKRLEMPLFYVEDNPDNNKIQYVGDEKEYFNAQVFEPRGWVEVETQQFWFLIGKTIKPYIENDGITEPLVTIIFSWDADSFTDVYPGFYSYYEDAIASTFVGKKVTLDKAFVRKYDLPTNQAVIYCGFKNTTDMDEPLNPRKYIRELHEGIVVN